MHNIYKTIIKIIPSDFAFFYFLMNHVIHKGYELFDEDNEIPLEGDCHSFITRGDIKLSITVTKIVIHYIAVL